MQRPGEHAARLGHGGCGRARLRRATGSCVAGPLEHGATWALAAAEQGEPGARGPQGLAEASLVGRGASRRGLCQEGTEPHAGGRARATQRGPRRDGMQCDARETRAEVSLLPKPTRQRQCVRVTTCPAPSGGCTARTSVSWEPGQRGFRGRMSSPEASVPCGHGGHAGL